MVLPQKHGSGLHALEGILLRDAHPPLVDGKSASHRDHTTHLADESIGYVTQPAIEDDCEVETSTLECGLELLGPVRIGENAFDAVGEIWIVQATMENRYAVAPIDEGCDDSPTRGTRAAYDERLHLLTLPAAAASHGS
jgi:hypothetical protein